ncbi:MAG: sigma-70 family RNA polymerase sigma factor [Planctomycetes bacterium]|nr:sigma-70 family RNA polymerase sigma factor [Planctomycetota bacterium]
MATTFQDGVTASLAPLLARAKERDRDAFDALVRALWEPVFRCLWKRVPAGDAGDLAQDVFFRLYRALRAGRGPALEDEEAWTRYVLACARNRAADYHRRRRAAPPTGPLEELLQRGEEPPGRGDPGDPIEPLVAREEAAAVRDCLGRLDPQARAVAWLHFVDGRPKREIARSLGMAESSFRGLLDRAARSLRKCLESKGALGERARGDDRMRETRPTGDERGGAAGTWLERLLERWGRQVRRPASLDGPPGSRIFEPPESLEALHAALDAADRELAEAAAQRPRAVANPKTGQ